MTTETPIDTAALDAWLAEKLLGWTQIDCGPTDCWLEHADDPQDRHQDFPPQLSGPDDWVGMGLVLEAMVNRGFCPTILFDDDGRWAMSLTSMTAPIGVIVPELEDYPLIWNEHLPTAVALAAKAALEAEA